MKIFYKDEFLLKDFVVEKARYQKVMLLYDDSVDANDIGDVYANIKGECVFNKQHIDSLDVNELNNGYRLLIFLCEANSFLKLQINRDDFFCVYLPTDDAVLPFFVVNGMYDLQEKNCIVLNRTNFDFNVLPSLYFNKFYKHIKDLYYFQISKVCFNFNIGDITPRAVLTALEDTEEGTEFVDIQIIKLMQIDYEYLPFVDYVLITGFMCVVSAAKNRTLNMVDLYKIIKDDSRLIDKYYALVSDGALLNLFTFNFNTINDILNKTSSNIIEYIANIKKPTKDELNEILHKISIFACKSDTLLNFLFLFNCFDDFLVTSA